MVDENKSKREKAWEAWSACAYALMLAYSANRGDKLSQTQLKRLNITPCEVLEAWGIHTEEGE